MYAASIEWEDGIADAWSQIAGFIPKLAVFLVVLIIGWLIAKLVARALGVVLEKIGFGRLLDKAGAGDALASTQIEPISLVTKLAYYFVLLIALQLALSAFGPTNPVSQIVNDIVAWLPKAFVAIVIVIVVAAVANAVRDILGASLGGVSYGHVLTKIVTAFILALGVIAALNQVGIGLSVTLPVLIAVLATVGGILVVGVGGALIGVARPRLELWVAGLERESASRPAAPTAAPAAPEPPPATPPPTTF